MLLPPHVRPPRGDSAAHRTAPRPRFALEHVALLVQLMEQGQQVELRAIAPPGGAIAPPGVVRPNGVFFSRVREGEGVLHREIPSRFFLLFFFLFFFFAGPPGAFVPTIQGLCAYDSGALCPRFRAFVPTIHDRDDFVRKRRFRLKTLIL